MEEFTYGGNKIRFNDDGTITTTTADGKTIQTQPGGGINVSLDKIRNIGIKHLPEVKKYSVINHEGLILHTVEFNNGGILALTYHSTGKLETLSCNGLRMTITAENDVLYYI